MSIAWRLKIVKYYRNAISHGYAYNKPRGTEKEPEYPVKEPASLSPWFAGKIRHSQIEKGSQYEESVKPRLEALIRLKKTLEQDFLLDRPGGQVRWLD